MMSTDEMLMALADNELPEAEARVLRAKIAADPALRAEYELYRATAETLRNSALLGPVPDRLLETVRSTPISTTEEKPPVQILRPQRWAGIAAAVVLAFVAGGYLSAPSAEFDPIDHAALPTGAAVTLPDGGELRALASYETEIGTCRTLQREGSDTNVRYILCQKDDGWQLELALMAPGGAAFVVASDPMTELLDDYLDKIGAGTPLTPAEEAEVLK